MEEFILSNFGDRFKKLRLSRGLTQDQLVDEFNEKYGYSFTKATISQYENNKRTPEMSAMMNFVEYFNVSLDYLLCNDGYIVKELGEKYAINSSSEFIELDDLIKIMNNLLFDGKIQMNEKSLNEDQKKVFKNCLDIAIELVKKEGIENN